MKLKHIAIGSALSVLMTAPAMAQQAAMAQNSAPTMQNSMKTQSSSQGKHMHPGVKAVQKKLNSRGYNVGSVDGLWGSRSEDALKKFQRANSLKTTGTLNRKTASALGVSGSQFAAFEAEVKRSSVGQQNSPGMKSGNSTGSGSAMAGSSMKGSSSMGSGSSMNGSGSISGGHGMAGTKPMGGSDSTGSGKY